MAKTGFPFDPFPVIKLIYEVKSMLFRKKMERRCGYCARAARLNDEELLCGRKGIRTPDEHCIFFRYDPTRRIPKKAKAMDFSKYDNEDFSL